MTHPICDSHRKQSPRLIYFASVPWESYAQRPHRFVDYFIKREGGRVLWVQPYPVRLPRPGDVRRRRGDHNQKTPRLPQVELLPVSALPVEPIPGLRAINRCFQRKALRRIKAFMSEARDLVIGVGKPSDLALRGLDAMSRGSSFYDAMDNYPDFYSGLSRTYMARLEARIVARVDRLLVSGVDIQQRLQRYGAAPQVVHNACDVGSIGRRSEARQGRPVLGYIGSIGHWFDWDLLIALAQAAPDARVCLVGPVLEPPTRPIPKNVVLLGPRRHDEAVEMLADFSVGLIPFKLNALTAGVDPIKYYEYICAGLPVISSAFGEMKQRGMADGVFQVTARDDLPAVLQRALRHELAEPFVEAFRQENDWSARLEGVFMRPLRNGDG